MQSFHRSCPSVHGGGGWGWKGCQKLKFAQNVIGSVLRHALSLYNDFYHWSSSIFFHGGAGVGQKTFFLEYCGKSKIALKNVHMVLPLTRWGEGGGGGQFQLCSPDATSRGRGRGGGVQSCN